jgi:superfamily II DNA helicase RecQ
MDNALPVYLTLPPGLGVVVCAQHGSAYACDNLSVHLQQRHHMIISTRRQIITLAARSGAVATLDAVRRPPDGAAPVPGLPVYDGYRCAIAGCAHLTTSKDGLRQHRAARHGGGRHQPPGVPVRLQTLFRKTAAVDYFVVSSPQQPSPDRGVRVDGDDGDTQATRRLLQDALSALDDGSDGGAADRLRREYEAAQQAHLQRYAVVEGRHHISELTGWLRSTKYQAYLEGVETTRLPASYALPRPDDGGEPTLHAICSSVARVLRVGMAMLDYDGATDARQLSRLDARLLNTFRRAEMSQDPIRPLQNGQSRANYIATLQKLTCYFYRTHGDDGGGLRSTGRMSMTEGRRRMFEVTPDQRQAWAMVRRLSGGLVTSNGGARTESDVARTTALLDDAVLAFLAALLQHALPEREFDSAIVSFCAVLAWDGQAQAWRPMSTYSSLLSHLIYDCQLIALRHCAAGGAPPLQRDGLTACLTAFRDAWLLNDTPGPIGWLLGTRLLAIEIGRSTVEAAKLRWEAGDSAVVYKDLRLPMRAIGDLVRHELSIATDLFARELCLGLGGDDAPAYRLRDLADNWDSRAPGGSFVTDVRNEALLAPGGSWLFDQMRARGAVAERMMRLGADGRWHVDAAAARRYEDAVQRFLESLLVLVHIASGQPARRTELLGLRWCNRQADVRSLFLHDGHAVFILAYHKSMNLTNASRYPVRALLPAVAALAVRYLVLVIPFRRWLARSVAGGGGGDVRRLQAEAGWISEYLWADGGIVWSPDRLTRVLASRSRLAIGIELTVQGWRQIAVGIALRKLTGAGARQALRQRLNDGAWAEGEGVQDRDGGDGGDDDDGDGEDGELPDALHWQASHAPATGNRAYGGTVNFRGGLTDAGLREFIDGSRLWHAWLGRLLVDKANEVRVIGGGAAPAVRKHRRAASSAVDSSLEASSPRRQQPPPPPPIKRRRAIAEDGFARIYRRCWLIEEATVALRQMYGPAARFRSPMQEQAVRTMIAGVSPVLAVLGTGEGKSLLYMLLSRLPGVGTTVLLVPLVALRQDTVRRCRLLGVAYYEWRQGGGGDLLPSPGTSLVIASLDQAVGAGSTRLQSYLRGLDAGGELAAVVLDECHLVLTAAAYREKMRRVYELRGLGCQLIYLTGTLPPTLEPALAERLLLQSPAVVRGRTARADIKYRVRRIRTGGAFLTDAIRGIRIELDRRSKMFEGEPAARVIVYCRTRQQAETVADELQCLCYHAGCGTTEQKAEILRRWTGAGEASNGERVLVATSAFVEGIDYPSVRAIFHVDTPDGCLTFAQAVGRGGRDGGGCTSYVILAKGWRGQGRSATSGLLDGDAAAIDRYLDEPRCRLAVLGEFLDGEGRLCEDTDKACDRCVAWRQHGQMKIEEGKGSRIDQSRVKESKAAIRTLYERDREYDRRAIGGGGGEARESGALLVRERVGKEEGRRQQVIEWLGRVCGRCVLCLSAGDAQGWRHSVDECHTAAKGEFLAGRRAVGGRWMAAYSGCFGCGLPQGLCGRLGSGGCEHRDVVIPLAWAIWRLGYGSGQAGGRAGGADASLTREKDKKDRQRAMWQEVVDEATYMRWLGERRTVMGGLEGSNMMAVAEAGLEQMMRGFKIE